jgi:chemotaxis protein MotB
MDSATQKDPAQLQQKAREIVIIEAPGEEMAGHHGGAWKVAYADFVTALMALFIVLWFMNTDGSVRKR